MKQILTMRANSAVAGTGCFVTVSFFSLRTARVPLR